MSDQMPAPENPISVFEEKTPMATMLSGGIFIAFVVYLIIGWLLDTFRLDLPIIQILFAIIVIIFSIQAGLKVEVRLTVNRKTGRIRVEGQKTSWEGYAHEPKVFMVLERKIEGRNEEIITEYKINIKLENIEFDILLPIQRVQEAIQVIEEAKKAIPV